ncbi:MAG: hypothetical protein GPOALKHO_000859 [Sodalis sp.]|nr:MAG: hypothetical protein GPOALKHO_000859 [Sodalis sp.]
MNGKNGLACITPLSMLRKGDHKIVIRPLPGLPVRPRSGSGHRAVLCPVREDQALLD